MRIAVLWTAPSGYLAASVRQLAESGDDVLFIHQPATAAAPYRDITRGLDVMEVELDPRVPGDELVERVVAFGPEVVLIGGWYVSGYRKIAGELKDRVPAAARVLCFDNQWRGTPRQRLGSAISRWYIQPLFDAAFVPGLRQWHMARRLGFVTERIALGGLACDYERITAATAQVPIATRPPAFLYVGRLAVEKGVRELVSAYGEYRRRAASPWPLLVAGTGPLESLVAETPGVESLGFLQPPELPGLLARARVLVMPSRLEPWGVAIIEALAGGLEVICTAACGASDIVVAANAGIILPRGRVSEIVRAMLAMTSRAPSEAVARTARQAAAPFRPSEWAESLRRFPSLIAASPMRTRSIR